MYMLTFFDYIKYIMPRTTLKLRTFSKPDEKIRKSGTQYYVESAKVISEYPGLKGDIVKKFVNGKLVSQKFVSKKRLHDLVKKSVKLAKHKSGGKTKRKKTNANPPKEVNVNVQNNTSMATEAKHGFAFGIGWAIGEKAVEAAGNMVSDGIANMFDE